MQVKGQFDGVEGSRAVGWIVQPDAPELVLTVNFFATSPRMNLTKLGRARANRPRPDLINIGMKEIYHGFDWRIPFLPSEFLLSARVGEYGEEITGSPVSVNPRPVYEGSLDGLERGILRGWSWAWDPAITVEVEIFVDGAYCATVPARTERPDLVLAGIGNGRHGFSWNVPNEFADGATHEFACRIGGTSVWLAGSPHSGIVWRTPRSLNFVESAVRNYGRRPVPQEMVPVWRATSPVGDEGARRITFGGSIRAALEAFRTGIPQTLTRANQPHIGSGSMVAAPRKRVRLLIPVWGTGYIEVLCRNALPSFLAPNNLPYLAGIHQVDIVFLTRKVEQALFDRYPAYRQLSKLVPTIFMDIDDILTRYFDPEPHPYATALTYAFYRGIQSMGEAACDTDFLFWNADFVAADGVFRTLADLIAAGVPCTLAPSLRISLAARSELTRRITDEAVLDVGPREFLALASRFPHPTVMAQTVNRFEERMVDSVNQLYWHISKNLTVGRVFLMFMLHIRPEKVWSDVYGHCDFTFIPELVPSGDYHFETHSDRLLILELQGPHRESGEIILGDRSITPREVAGGVSRWTTREHRLASRHLVIFNTDEIGSELEPARQTADKFMNAVYKFLPDPIWHNGHLWWTDSLSTLGLDYDSPGADHPRSHLAAALRWTGYDIDVLRESWPSPSGPPNELFGLALPLVAGFDIGAYLAEVHLRYYSEWLRTYKDVPVDSVAMDLVSGHFHGFGWGLVEHDTHGWSRHIGPDGWAMLLVKVARPCVVQVALLVPDGAKIQPETFGIHVNGCAIDVGWSYLTPTGILIDFEVDHDVVEFTGGCLQILFCVSTERPGAGNPAHGGFTFSDIAVKPIGLTGG